PEGVDGGWLDGDLVGGDARRRSRAHRHDRARRPRRAGRRGPRGPRLNARAARIPPRVGGGQYRRGVTRTRLLLARAEQVAEGIDALGLERFWNSVVATHVRRVDPPSR